MHNCPSSKSQFCFCVFCTCPKLRIVLRMTNQVVIFYSTFIWLSLFLLNQYIIWRIYSSRNVGPLLWQGLSYPTHSFDLGSFEKHRLRLREFAMFHSEYVSYYVLFCSSSSMRLLSGIHCQFSYSCGLAVFVYIRVDRFDSFWTLFDN